MVCEEYLRTGNIIITLIRQTGAADGEYILYQQLTTAVGVCNRQRGVKTVLTFYFSLLIFHL